MDFTFDSFIYSGQYGSDNNIASMITTNIIIPNNNDDVISCNIILIVDTSSSMIDYRRYIIEILLNFYNNIYLNVSKDVSLDVITFNFEPVFFWRSNRDINFKEKIYDIDFDTYTNIGEAMNLAFSSISEKYTHIFLITDCNPTIGFTKASDILNYKPYICEITCIGLGDIPINNFFKSLGDYTHISNINQIPIVVKNLTKKALGTFGIYAEIIYPTGVDYSIFARFITGYPTVGQLFYGKNFNVTFLPYGDEIRESIEWYFDEEIVLSYYDIKNKKIQTKTSKIRKEHLRPYIFPELYYKCSFGRLIQTLLEGDIYKKKAVMLKVSSWDNNKYKKKIRDFFKSMKYIENHAEIHRYILDIYRQYSYHNSI